MHVGYLWIIKQLRILSILKHFWFTALLCVLFVDLMALWYWSHVKFTGQIHSVPISIEKSRSGLKFISFQFSLFYCNISPHPRILNKAISELVCNCIELFIYQIFQNGPCQSKIKPKEGFSLVRFPWPYIDKTETGRNTHTWLDSHYLRI